MIKVFRWAIVILASAGFIALIIFLLFRLTPKPPVTDMEYARETLSEAGASKADTYSKKLYSEAKAAYDSAMTNWQRENEKFIYFRKYSKVHSYAELASRKAKLAAENSINNSNHLKSKLIDEINSLNETSAKIDKLFGRYPFNSEIRNRISKGKMLLLEGEVTFSKGQYLTANRKIIESEYLLKGVYDLAVKELKDYFDSYPRWRKWTQSAISDSRKNKSYSIIVDKYSGKLYIYLNGIKKYEFDAELGRNWIGDKRKMGDKATPEGMYKVTKKFQGRETEYHKSLAIDYPNPEDKERFNAEIKHGTLPANAKIGGGIEIHGGGGRGIDWTEGCIALTDSEIDIVFNLTKAGTPVTIVGSMKEIGEILEK